MADANIPYHCHTERPQVGHVLGDAIVILITRQEVHTHHQVADVHTRIMRIHFPYTAIRDIPTVTPRGSVSVFVTGNEIYMVGHRITSLMVAQGARNETRGLDRFGPSGGGNTLRPVCGCIIPVLGCALGLLEVMVV